MMHVSAVKSLLTALRQLSSQCLSGNSQLLGQHIGTVVFSVERMASILVNNLHSKHLVFKHQKSRASLYCIYFMYQIVSVCKGTK